MHNVHGCKMIPGWETLYESRFKVCRNTSQNYFASLLDLFNSYTDGVQASNFCKLSFIRFDCSTFSVGPTQSFVFPFQLQCYENIT